MKNITKFLFSVACLVCLVGACQNQSNTQSSSETADSAHHGGIQAQPSAMTKVMDNMMADMHQLKMTGNLDVDFALMMKSHHQGAVEMAQVELSLGKDSQLKAMAQKIVDTQKSEINTLDAFINHHQNAPKTYNPADQNDPIQKTMVKSMNMMMDIPQHTESRSIDHQFADLMIPHHQSAIYMSEALINYGKDPKLIAMAKKMISDQSKEVDELKQWQQANQTR